MFQFVVMAGTVSNPSKAVVFMFPAVFARMFKMNVPLEPGWWMYSVIK